MAVGGQAHSSRYIAHVDSEAMLQLQKVCPASC
jgi:hypothetical protein